MALGTYTQVVGERSRSVYASTFTVVGDGAYATGGTASFSSWFSQQQDLGSATLVSCHGLSTTGTYEARWVASTNKLQVFVTATGAEVADATDLSGATFQLTAIYK